VGDQTSASERAAAPQGWRLQEAQRNAVYSVIAARRDIRRFRPDPVPEDTLRRVLGAGHAAPSVGHCQPWRFIVVSDAGTRQRAALMAERERQRQAHLLDEDAGRRMMDLQLEGIPEAPLGIVACCDRRAPASGVLGRATFADTDLWSCACAIENMWLAARAEGLGMGWVTLFPPRELAALLGLPFGVETLGWLCLGWPDERPPSPGLERAGWSRRAPLEDVVMRERWPEVGPAAPLSRLLAPNQAAVVAARDQADRLLSAPGSLGVLGKAVDRVVALGKTRLDGGTLVLVAADHPVTGLGVSTYPSSVSAEVLEATMAGGSLGAAAAAVAGLRVVAVDAGTIGGPVAGALAMVPAGPRGDLAHSDALALADVVTLMGEGRKLGQRWANAGSGLVALGEVGIGNTTVAAALCSALLDLPPSETVGLGAGGDSETLERKLAVVVTALARTAARRGAGVGPVQVLSALGGPEVAVMAGVTLGVADGGGVVVLDGLVTSVAALCAVRLEPGAAAHLVAGQRSREKAHGPVLAELGLEPILDLRMRAGEGVGAVMASRLLTDALNMRARTARVDY